MDLLYNGGIGTYVKAASRGATPTSATAPTTACASTAASCARAWSARAATSASRRGAGSSTGRRGGLINTDAVDNSGGVDTSDHEVNIKILLDLLVKKGVVKGREERNRILAEMTDEVAAARAGRQRQPGAWR